MRERISVVVRLVIAVVLAGAGGALLVRPARAPAAVGVALVTTFWPLVRAWRDAGGSALRSAVVWAGLAVVLGCMTQAVAWSEPLATGRPASGHWAYLSVLAALAAVLSVLNARRPGSRAWAALMALLVLVFLIPWLEGAGPAGHGGPWARLHLEAPWTLFYLLLAVMAVSNYLPTRSGLASVWLALALGLEYLGLTRPDWPLPRRAVVWSAAPWALAAAIWTADALARRPAPGEPGLERLWFWFRDRWGAVWGLRMQERFNRSAEILGWPVRLGWFGVMPVDGSSEATVPQEAEQAFRGLLRRFAEPERLETAQEPRRGEACQHRGGE